jgi:predicted RNase H-like HicB family nuclease
LQRVRKKEHLSVHWQNATLILLPDTFRQTSLHRKKGAETMKFFYPVIVTKKETGYYAEFPDLEMCTAEGETMDEVLDNAREAAYTWIDAELAEENPELPASSDKADLQAAAEPGQDVREILITYRMMDGWEE